MKISCDISLGEFLDKISILKVKNSKIQSENALNFVKKELEVLNSILNNIGQPFEDEIQRLFEVNSKLWEIEDEIREKEAEKDFGVTFIELARSVYKTNDLRFKIKKEINEQFSPSLQEVKSYKKYEEE